jgi:hypothetical protein
MDRPARFCGGLLDAMSSAVTFAASVWIVALARSSTTALSGALLWHPRYPCAGDPGPSHRWYCPRLGWQKLALPVVMRHSQPARWCFNHVPSVTVSIASPITGSVTLTLTGPTPGQRY